MASISGTGELSPFTRRNRDPRPAAARPSPLGWQPGWKSVDCRIEPWGRPQLQRHHHLQQRGGVANASRENRERFRDGRMLLRQHVETVAHFVELRGFLQNLIRGHGLRSLLGALLEAGPAFITTVSHLHYASF